MLDDHSNRNGDSDSNSGRRASGGVGGCDNGIADGRGLLRDDKMQIDNRLMATVEEQPYPLLFVTISGAHLYGFPSPDSDYDLRGVHILPVEEIVGLDPGRETVESSMVRDGIEIDLVTHDIRKFFLLLLKRNGYVLEQLYSPLVVQTTPEHEELKRIAKGCITCHHAHHYLGFAQTQWRLFEKEEPRRVKPLLYTFRVLLTGIHLMRTGEIEANLLRLNEDAKLPYIGDLVARKVAGGEQAIVGGADVSFFELEYRRLVSELEEAHRTTGLPDRPSCRQALNDLLVRVRLAVVPDSSRGSRYFQMACEVETPPEGATLTCPACGMEDAFAEPGVYDICPRCRWEDDPVQFANPYLPGGANRESLNQARARWKRMLERAQRRIRREM